MTQVSEPRGVDSDRVDGGRGLWRSAVVALTVGLLVGAFAGALYGRSRPSSFQATTALSVLPDSTISTQQDQGAPTQDATSFIQSQLVVLNGSQLAEQVQKQLSLATSPNLSSVQVGQSYVVQVTATAGNRQQALATATAAGNAYAALRLRQLTSTINASIASTRAQLAAVRANLISAQNSATPNTGSTPSETALQTEYERLLSVSSALSLASSQAQRVVTVLTPAGVAAGSLSMVTKDAVGGMLAGALLGLVVLIALRRAVPRVRTIGDVAALGVPVLLPVLPRRSWWARHGRAAWRSSAGRLLAARLTGRGPGPTQPVIVVGATPGVGTSFVATSLAAALAERGPVLMVLATELVDRPRGQVLAGAPAPNPGALTTGDPVDVAELIQRARPAAIPGVWVLECDPTVPELAGALPSTRSALLADIMSAATASGWLVVVDAPALSDSDLVLDCTAGGGVATLVVGRGVSRTGEVLSAVELFDAHATHFEGVILNDTPGRFMRRRQPARDIAPVSVEQPERPPLPVDTVPAVRRPARPLRRSTRSTSPAAKAVANGRRTDPADRPTRSTSPQTTATGRVPANLLAERAHSGRRP